jgi:hypothetical protein
MREPVPSLEEVVPAQDRVTVDDSGMVGLLWLAQIGKGAAMICAFERSPWRWPARPRGLG